jgi:hypothetical protein
MSSKLRIAVVAVGVVGLLIVGAGPASAGITTISVTGAFVCNTTTGNYDITWTITKTNDPSVPTTISSATQNPGGALTASPNPIPSGGLNSATATSSLPGSTSGAVTLTVVILVSPNSTIGTITLDGTCVIAAAPVVTPPRLTG